MSNQKTPLLKASKLSLGAKLTSSGNIQKAFVPPVLREVSKLAAGVASVNPSSGSATGKSLRILCIHKHEFIIKYFHYD